MEETFKKSLDKSLTVNNWSCRLDLNLRIRKSKLFSKRYYAELLERLQSKFNKSQTSYIIKAKVN